MASINFTRPDKADKTDAWASLKNRIISKQARGSEKGNKEMWDNATPELIIEFCRHNLGSFGKLKKKLSECDSNWIEGFLEHNGLLFIFESLEALSRVGLGNFLDAVKQLECISCLRAVMNNRSGLECIIKSDEFQKVFAEQMSKSLDTENVLLKSHIVELLSAISLYSLEGFDTTMDTLAHLQTVRGLPYILSSVMNEIQRAHKAEQASYLVTLLSFVNVLIVSQEDLDGRNETRQEFIILGLPNILDELRFTEKEELKSQIDAYHYSANQDLEETDIENSYNEIDVESEEALVKSLTKKLKGTASFEHFLHILQSLYIIESAMDAACNEQKWRSLDHAMCSLIINYIDSNQGNELDERILMKKTLKDSVSQMRLKPEFRDEELVIQVPKSNANNVKTLTKEDKEVQTDKIMLDAVVSTDKRIENGGTKQRIEEVKATTRHEIPEGYVFPDPPPDLPEVEESKPKIPDPPLDLPEVEASKPKVPAPPPNLPGVISEDDGNDTNDPRIPKPPPNLPGVESCDSNCENSKIPKPPPNMPGVKGCEEVKGGNTKGAAPDVMAKPSKKLRTLKWDKFSEKDVQKKDRSIWKAIDISEFTLDHKCIQRVEEEYSIKEVVKSVTEKTNKKEKITFFDQRAGMNICIFLKQFKQINLRDIIKNGDEKTISLEQIKAFAKILPETSVANQIKEYSDSLTDLNEADYFFKEFIKLENYELRIQMLNTKLEYIGEYQELNPNLDKLEMACNEILNNALLNKIMGLVLTVGNFINYGSYAGSAAGFKISSLSKLNDTRANKPRVTLMNSVVDIAEEKFPELLKLAESMPTLESALRLSSDQLSDSVRQIHTKVDQMQAKTLNAASELREQVIAFLKISQPQIDELKEKATRVTKMSTEICQFYAEDPKVYKLEDFMKVLFQFTKDFDKAVKENVKRREDEARKERISEKQKLLSEKKPKLGKLGTVTTKPEDGDIIEKLMGEIRNGMTLKSFSEVRKSTICEDEATRKSSIASKSNTSQRCRRKTSIKRRIETRNKIDSSSLCNSPIKKVEEEKHTDPSDSFMLMIPNVEVNNNSSPDIYNVTPDSTSTNKNDMKLICNSEGQTSNNIVNSFVNINHSIPQPEVIRTDKQQIDEHTDRGDPIENQIKSNKTLSGGLNEIEKRHDDIRNNNLVEETNDNDSLNCSKEDIKRVKKGKREDKTKELSPKKSTFWKFGKKTNKSPK